MNSYKRGKLMVQLLWTLNVVLLALVAVGVWTFSERGEAEFSQPAELVSAAPVATFDSHSESTIDVVLLENETMNRSKAALVVIIEGLGHDQLAKKYLSEIDLPLILSILPQVEYGKEYSKLAQEKGWLTMVNVPMEPVNLEEIDHPSCLTSDRNSEDVVFELDKMLYSLPGVVGLSNYQGDKLTANGRLMDDIANYCKSHSLFIVDNKTSGSSQLYRRAKAAHVPVFRRDIYVDGDGTPGTESSVKRQLIYAEELALREERPIVVVARPREATLKVLAALPTIIDVGKVPVIGVDQLLD